MKIEYEWVEKGETTRWFLFGIVIGMSISTILIFAMLASVGVI